MVKTILFDMGGVVFVQDTTEAFRRFSEIGLDANSFLGDYGQKGIFLSLETGEITDEEFRMRLSRMVGRELTWDEVQHCWLGFIKSVPADRLDALEQLRKSYRICLASNTNPFIMAYTRSDRFSGDGRGIDAFFDKLYLSYEMGVCKPDEAFFREILSAEGIHPEEAIFIDDSRANVLAAESLGIKGLWIPPDSDFLPSLNTLLQKENS